MSNSPGVLVVTGGSRGIGAEVVRLASAAGWAVCFTYLTSKTAAEQLTGSLVSAGGVVRAVQADISREDDVVSLFAAAAELGPVRGLVANAAIVTPPLHLKDYAADRVRRVLEVNVLGTILCCREAVKQMSLSNGYQGGAIVLVSSAASRLGSPGEYVDYAASKGAIDSLGVGLAREVASEGIRVNVVRPGTTLTEIHARNGQAGRVQQMESRIPLGRAAEAVEIAEAIMWLVSDSASYCVGSVLDVAGGR